MYKFLSISQWLVIVDYTESINCRKLVIHRSLLSADILYYTVGP